MFDIDVSSSAPHVPVPADPAPEDPAPVPLERLEAQICELAGHLTAATCRFLVLLADFDARRGWGVLGDEQLRGVAVVEVPADRGDGREHVRVARALADLPVIRGEFAAASLSYAKVRALTRIATPETERGLAELAGPMTGNQLERFARAHRRVSSADDAAARVRRRLAWRFEDDGSLAGTFRLPPLAGAVLLKALRAAVGVSAETPGHPADPARCHVEDGPALSVSTAQLLGCTAALSWMHDRDGTLLDLGRRRRRPSAALRRAARDRDMCRCRFPGCESRRVDLHHIQYWSNGGATKLENLVSLCKYHHMVVHERGYLIAVPSGCGGAFAFYRPDGTALPASPPLPPPYGRLEDTHDTDINPETIIPPWYGERLDLDHAIYVCFANARTEEDKQADGALDGDPAERHRVQVYEPEDWPERIRQYYDEQDGRTPRPVLIPMMLPAAMS